MSLCPHTILLDIRRPPSRVTLPYYNTHNATYILMSLCPHTILLDIRRPPGRENVGTIHTTLPTFSVPVSSYNTSRHTKPPSRVPLPYYNTHNATYILPSLCPHTILLDILNLLPVCLYLITIHTTQPTFSCPCVLIQYF